jgi:hypothetical protein
LQIGIDKLATLSVATGRTEEASISVFNPHAFGADAAGWIFTLIEIVRGPASALVGGMPGRFAERSSVPSPIEKTSFEEAKHRVNNTAKERETYPHQAKA